VIGVGDKLLEELFEPSFGVTTELTAAITEFIAKRHDKEQRVISLEARAAAGGVKGTVATNELNQLRAAGIQSANTPSLSLAIYV
jgi:hypothetical protein